MNGSLALRVAVRARGVLVVLTVASASPLAAAGVRAQSAPSTAVAGEARASEPDAAAPRTAALSWVRLPGAEACPSTQDVARAVEDRLGRAAFVSAADAELAVEGRIEVVPEGFRATLAVADASGASLGERVLEQASGGEGGCAQILPALALTIALTIDPDALSRSVEPHPDPEGEPETHDPVVVVEPAPPDPWRLEITATAVGALGLSPTVAPGGALTIALTPPGFVPLFVHGTLLPWSRAEPSGSPPLDVLQTYFGLGICPLAFRETAPVALLACAGIDVGALVALGARETLTEPERITVQADVSFGVHVAIVGPLYFAADVSLLVPFRPDAYLLRGPPERPWFRPEPVAGVLALGVGVDLAL